MVPVAPFDLDGWRACLECSLTRICNMRDSNGICIRELSEMD
jgi:hypothetical protein